MKEAKKCIEVVRAYEYYDFKDHCYYDDPILSEAGRRLYAKLKNISEWWEIDARKLRRDDIAFVTVVKVLGSKAGNLEVVKIPDNRYVIRYNNDYHMEEFITPKSFDWITAEVTTEEEADLYKKLAEEEAINLPQEIDYDDDEEEEKKEDFFEEVEFEEIRTPITISSLITI